MENLLSIVSKVEYIYTGTMGTENYFSFKSCEFGKLTFTMLELYIIVSSIHRINLDIQVYEENKLWIHVYPEFSHVEYGKLPLNLSVCTMWEIYISFKYTQNEYIQVYVENKLWIHVYSEYGKSIYTLLSCIRQKVKFL